MSAARDSRLPALRRYATAGAFLAALLAAPLSAAQAGAATSDPRATQAALDLMAAGGNAVDGAVGAALVLAVVFPEAGNLGGGGFAVVKVGDELAALDFRETAPAAASAAMYLDANGDPRLGASTLGALAAGVPGSPAGYEELHRRFGRLPWSAVVAPAIAFARDGFALSARTAQTLAEARDPLSADPDTAQRWIPGGLPLGAGSRLVLPDLATTLEQYASGGAAAIAEGRAGAAIERLCRAKGGILTAADLARYRPAWREPLRFSRLGLEFAAMPLPSSGGMIVDETLALLELEGWWQLPRASAERAQLLTEALRRAFADRFALGDPSGESPSLDRLLLPGRLTERAATIDLTRATPSSALAVNGAAAAHESTDTTNVSVVDGDGNAVDLTTTLNNLIGNAIWVAQAGFFLNDEMDDFTTAPGRPNSYHLIQGNANRIVPGRRPLSSMSPMIAWRGAEVLAIGGRGGSLIPSAAIQVLLDLEEGDAAAAAVARPRLHHQWLPDQLFYEPGALSAAARSSLADRGYEVVPLTQRAEVNVVRRLASGEIDAAGDPRADEAAAAVELPSNRSSGDSR
jgi:gamma-glutamyltranspeptidase / glutathione hydrolase